MASISVRTTHGITRSIAWMAAALLALLLTAHVGGAQENLAQPMPVRAREALRLGIECYKRGDTENAANFSCR